MMRGLLSLLPVALLLGGCIASPVAAPVDPRGLTFAALEFVPPEVPRTLLPGGGRLYFREDRELPLVEITVVAGAGSIGEPAERTGLVSLFATSWRTGGAGEMDPLAFDEELERLAADLSISADAYTVTLHLSLHSDDLDRGMALLSELLRHPRFAPEQIVKARQQMLEGIRRRDDHPGSQAQRLLMAALYPGHPFGRVPEEETVTAVTRDELLAFHQRFIHPANLHFAVSGDVAPERLSALLTTLLAEWPVPDWEPQPQPPLPPLPPAQLWLAPKEIPQTTVLMGHRGIAKDDPELYAVRVMNFILGGGGFNARLMREVRSNRGLAYSVYSHYDIGRRLPGAFFAGCETKNATALEAAGLMRALMAELRNEAVTEEELRLAKDSLVNSFVFAFASSHDIVSRTLTLDLFDYPADYLQRYRERIESVTLADVQRAAEHHLRPDELTMVLVGHPAEFATTVETLGLPLVTVESGR